MHAPVLRRRALPGLALAAGLALGLAACSPPPPRVRRTLRIGDDGSYRLDDQPLPAGGLRAAFEAARSREPALFVDIVASPRAGQAVLMPAVDALKAAGVRFAFVDESIMRGLGPAADASSPPAARAASAGARP